AAINKIIPLRDQVVYRATRSHACQQRAGVTEWHTAIHAAGALVAQQRLVGVAVELVPVVDAIRGRADERQLARIVEKPGRLAHGEIPGNEPQSHRGHRAKNTENCEWTSIKTC